ncbi:MAG: hypothetical protein AB1414_20005, partial [bacterium]
YYKYIGSPYDSIYVGGPEAYWAYWNVTELVQEWYFGIYQNEGIMLIANSEIGDWGKIFVSKDDREHEWAAPVLIVCCNKPPNKPTNPFPTNGAVKVKSDVTLKWNCTDSDGDKIVDYHIRIADNPNFNSPLFDKRIGSSVPEFNPAKNGINLTTGTTYYWAVWGFDGHEWTSIPVDPWHFLVGIDPGPFEVSGTFMYQDRPYTINGFNFGEYYEPIRYALVHVIEVDSGTITVIGTCSTDILGQFDFTIDNNIDTGTETPGRDIAVRCYSCSYSDEHDYPQIHASNVKDLNSTVYKIESDIGYNWEGGNLNIGTIKEPSGTESAAFNILDVITSGYKWASDVIFPNNPPQVEVYWPNGANISYYNPNNDSIYILGDTNDPDQYDDGVILHEYGHFLMDQYSYDHSPGGDHSWLQRVDSRLAWSEGWAHFVACVTNNNPENYVDNFFDNNSPKVYGFNIETTEDSFGNQPPINYGKENEGLVAGSLWDISDNMIDGKDTLMMGSEEIWDVFDKYITNSMTCDIEDFWKGWFAYNYGYGAQVWDIFMQHGMNLDTNSPQNVTNLHSPSHTPWIASNNPYVSVAWTHALDAESGIGSYSVAWDKNPLHTPDIQEEFGAINNTTSHRLEDVHLPFGWWFHIRGVDRAGNWGPAEHLGPFLIDTIPPKAELVPESVP